MNPNVEAKAGAATKVGNMRVKERRATREGGAGAATGVEGRAGPTNFAHFTEEGAGITLSPATVLTMSLIFISFVIVLHIYGKFTQ